MPQFAEQFKKLGTETAFAVSDLANQWQRQGNTVFPFHLGDTNLSPPPAFIDAVYRALIDGKNGYCPSAGIPLLKEQLARLIGQERQIKINPENISVQPGGKPVIHKFLATTLNPGDGVAYPIPGFPIYASQIRYQGAIPHPYCYYRTNQNQFELDMDSLKRAITDTTKVLIINNHHNPTGATHTQDTLNAIADIANQHNLWVLSDEAYFNIRYDQTPPTSIFNHPAMQKRGVLLFTASKQWAMTGWRLGAAIGDKTIIDKINQFNTNIESCTNHFIQHAIGEVLKQGHVDNSYIIDTLNDRRQILVTLLNTIDGINVAKPKSGFYVYGDVRQILQRKNITDVNQLMQQTLIHTGVSFCTGVHFGEDENSTHIRLAFSGIKKDHIIQGITALKHYFEY